MISILLMKTSGGSRKIKVYNMFGCIGSWHQYVYESWWVWTCMAVGLDKIEFLQNHENHEIYQKAFDIIEQYFGSEEEEDRSIAPSAGDQQFNFAADMPDAVQSSGFQFWWPAPRYQSFPSPVCLLACVCRTLRPTHINHIAEFSYSLYCGGYR